MNNILLKSLKAQSHTLQPSLRIGKSGFSEGIIDEAKKQLKKKNLIKIKLLGAIVEEKERDEIGSMIDDFVRKVDAEIIHRVGFTLTIYKKSAKKEFLRKEREA